MVRERVHQKYGGRCAYCGEEITIKQMHVDHLKPVWRGNHTVNRKFKGDGEIENLMPSCRACNLWKSVRSEIAAQVDRLRLRSANFRMAERYGLVNATGNQVIFWFEKIGG
jgi:5-methylcytosine-specific restriction endonuclease McrA